MENTTMIQTSKVCKLLKWNGVALWVYDSEAENCGICRNPLREVCIKCQGDQEKLENVKCQKVVGRCNHMFHCHCIDEWINKQNKCPSDFSDWMPMQYLD